MGVVKHKHSRKKAPHESKVHIKANYLFKLDPSSSRSRLGIVGMVLLCVPVGLVIPFSVFDIFVLVFFVGSLIVIIVNAKLFIQILEPFSSIKVLSCFTLLSMMFKPVEKVIIVGVIFKLFSNPLLLMFERLFHSISRFSIFPILICLLIFKVSSRRIPKD